MGKINEIEETIGLLDNVQRKAPDESFYSDLMSRIESGDYRKKDNLRINHKNLLLVVILLINLFTLIYFYSANRNSMKDQKLKACAKVYKMDHSTSDMFSYGR